MPAAQTADRDHMAGGNGRSIPPAEWYPLLTTIEIPQPVFLSSHALNDPVALFRHQAALHVRSGRSPPKPSLILYSVQQCIFSTTGWIAKANIIEAAEGAAFPGNCMSCDRGCAGLDGNGSFRVLSVK
jgi:hypothetical protein